MGCTKYCNGGKRGIFCLCVRIRTDKQNQVSLDEIGDVFAEGLEYKLPIWVELTRTIDPMDRKLTVSYQKVSLKHEGVVLLEAYDHNSCDWEAVLTKVRCQMGVLLATLPAGKPAEQAVAEVSQKSEPVIAEDADEEPSGYSTLMETPVLVIDSFQDSLRDSVQDSVSQQEKKKKQEVPADTLSGFLALLAEV